MATVNSTVLPASDLTNITPTITNFVVVNPSTEYSFNLPANCRKFMIQSRLENAKIQLAYSPLQTSSIYITIWQGCCYVDDSYYVSQTIYFQSSLGSNTLEIVTFS